MDMWTEDMTKSIWQKNVETRGVHRLTVRPGGAGYLGEGVNRSASAQVCNLDSSCFESAALNHTSFDCRTPACFLK